VDTTKAITLQSANEYTTGKVAVVSGTVGTGTVTITFAAPGFTSAAGSAVAFSSVSRLVFAAGSTTLVRCTGVATGKPAVLSRGSQAAVSEVGSTETAVAIAVDAASGTSSYTLVLYGD
jgi:hypothetical protein